MEGRLPFIIFTIIVSTFSCSSHNSNNIPRWVLHPSLAGGKFYSVGWCGKTLFKKDAEKCAVNRAITEMAVSLSSAVVSAQKMGSCEGDAFIQGKEEVFVPIQLLRNLKKSAEVIDVWHDEKGKAGEPGITYALVKFNIDKLQFSGFFTPQKSALTGEKHAVKCAGSTFPVKPDEVINAEGICERTLFLYPGFSCARKRALSELARIVALKVINKMFDFQGKWSGCLSATSIFAAAALSGTKVKNFFRDKSGNTHVIVQIKGRDLIRSLRQTGDFLASLDVSPYKEIGKCIISITEKKNLK